MPKLGEKSDSGAQTSDARNYAASLRVLAVDDNIVCLTFLSRLLKKCNYQFTATKKTNEACQILMNNRDSYDIVLTNVKANKDGFRLAEMIIKVQLDIPVVFVSANDGVEVVRECVRIGVDYLPKPVHLADIKLIWKHVARREHLQKSSSKKEKINSSLIHSLTWDTQSIREIENKKKQRFKWGTKLHDKFVTAINKLGIEKAVPKRILEIMDEPTLSRENVSSHLQKYRRNLDKEKERAKNKYQDVEKAVNYLQFSDARKQIRSSIVNGPIIHPSPSTWPEHESEGMRMKITYLRPQENENNYFESIACFSDGHNSNGGSVSMPPSINSLPMLSQSSSYGQLHGSTQLTRMSHPVNFQTLPHSSNPYGPIYVQGTKQSGPMAETANSIIMVPPSSPCGPIHIRDSSHPSPTIGQLERCNSLDTFPDYYEDYQNSDCEFDEDLRAMWKAHSALTLDHPN